jgi:recombination protein RecT
MNQVQKQSSGGVKAFNQYLTHDGTQKYLEQVLGEKKEKFVTNLTALVMNNQTLAECTPTTLMSCAIVATSLNLSMNASFGYAYAVPYNNKKSGSKEAQFQIGYKGYIQLAMRTGQYQKINAVPIYENQFIRYNEVFEDLQLNNIDGVGKVVGYVAYFKLTNGFEKLIYWSYDKMLNHADKFSMAFSSSKYAELLSGKVPQKEQWKYSSFWYKDFDEMAKKTMLRQVLSKYGILTEEMQVAYKNDMAVIKKDETHYVDNEQSLNTNIENVELEIKNEEIIDIKSDGSEFDIPDEVASKW